MTTDKTDLAPLLSRSSTGKLQEPAPSPALLEKILSTALRAPDHGGIKPWYFIVVTGDQRPAFVDHIIESFRRNRPDMSEEKLEKRKRYYNSIPLFIVLGMRLQEASKIPLEEQKMAVGAGVMNILNGLEFQHYAGMWITGPLCHDSIFLKQLGRDDLSSIAGILFVGSPTMPRKRPERPSVKEHFSYWRQDENHPKATKS